VTKYIGTVKAYTASTEENNSSGNFIEAKGINLYMRKGKYTRIPCINNGCQQYESDK
jgi:hypothetical protein